ncbi:MAG: DUF4352 domain-containing protein [Candidatus Micrarchaeaceae archaeon]
MTKKEWAIIGVLGATVGVIFLCLGCMLLGMLASQTSPTSPVVIQVVITATPERSAPSTVEPTNTPLSTRTPRPTDTPKPTETPRSLPTQSVGKVGQRMESAGIAITVNKVSKVKQVSEYIMPEAGKIYLVLDVLIENVSRIEETPYNPLYFMLKDQENFDYDVSLFAPEPSLKAGTLRKGDKARGNVAFEVPINSKGFIVRYEPLVLFGGYQPIRISLGQ